MATPSGDALRGPHSLSPVALRWHRAHALRFQASDAGSLEKNVANSHCSIPLSASSVTQVVMVRVSVVAEGEQLRSVANGGRKGSVCGNTPVIASPYICPGMSAKRMLFTCASHGSSTAPGPTAATTVLPWTPGGTHTHTDV